MPVNYVTTEGPNPKIKKRNQEEFDLIKKEKITSLGVNEEWNEDIDEEEVEELELVEPNIEVPEEGSRINRLEKQDSLGVDMVWTIYCYLTLR